MSNWISTMSRAHVLIRHICTRRVLQESVKRHEHFQDYSAMLDAWNFNSINFEWVALVAMQYRQLGERSATCYSCIVYDAEWFNNVKLGMMPKLLPKIKLGYPYDSWSFQKKVIKKLKWEELELGYRFDFLVIQKELIKSLDETVRSEQNSNSYFYDLGSRASLGDDYIKHIILFFSDSAGYMDPPLPHGRLEIEIAREFEWGARGR